jgi:hypothetical protein
MLSIRPKTSRRIWNALATIRSRLLIVNFSTETKNNRKVDSISSEAPKWIEVYTGYYAKKLGILRKISISSSALSVVGMPVVVALNSGNLSLAAKVMIAGVAISASLGSTAVLHGITFPYVVKLEATILDDGALRFMATRLNLLGKPRFNEFSLDDIQKIKVSQHPYANFQAKGEYFYVRHQSIDQEELQKQFAARCN